MHILVTTWFGTFVMDDDHNVTDHRLFPKEAHEIAERLKSIAQGELLYEEKTLATQLGRFAVLEPRLTQLGAQQLDARAIPIMPENYGYGQDMLRDALLEMGKAKMGLSLKETEVINAITVLDELAKMSNQLQERAYELALYELQTLTEHLTMLREQVTRTRDDVDKNLCAEMERLMPNLTALAGPLVGARLLASSGSLEKLARMPSSTIQLLGAENALFRHLRTGSKPPKHGIIFQHPLIHNAPRKLRGKIARAFAGKIAIAAKMDNYSGQDIGKKLNAALQKRVEQIYLHSDIPPTAATLERMSPK